MIEGQPSQTAFMTAVQRGHHYHTAPEPKVLRDDLALALAGLESVEAAEKYLDAMIEAFAALSDRETAEIFMGRVDASVCMRSRVVEEELAIARERGLRQLIILGAGLDSTAYRCMNLTDGLQVFEVDHPSTQAWKIERVKAAGIPVPENLTYVPYDFENETLAHALAAGGIRIDKVSFFTWLGVHMYLTDEAVKSTLAVLGQYPPGSELVMDFISPEYQQAGGLAEDSVAQLSQVVADMGEPMKSKYLESELEQMLRDVGYGEVKFLSARWLVNTYLGGNNAAFNMPDAATSILMAVKV